MPTPVEKVTAFITREQRGKPYLLLFEHPSAGIQIPAGTVESGEPPEAAVIREVAEETGLRSPSICRHLGCVEGKLPEGQRIIAEPTKVYAQPDATSFDGAHLRQGIPIALLRQAGGFSHVIYEEFDRVPNPHYVTLSITGWVPDEVLADSTRRHFFHLEFAGHSEERWTVFADNHRFVLFWAPLSALPEIIYPQSEWLEFLPESLRQPKMK
jgi:8-oxo-dGTP pyrophosphatase MutT (NUDIX family)